jgi:hypothetical protein
VRAVPTAPLAASGLIGGYAVAVATGSRPLGGVVIALAGGACVTIWLRRDGRRTAAVLSGVGAGAFVLSHALGPLIGAWPAVLAVSAATAAACWRLSDADHLQHRSRPVAAAASELEGGA